jgi:Uma2 family endonuclease
MISSAPFPPMTAAEYLDWEPQQEQRYEFINDEIIAMTGGTRTPQRHRHQPFDRPAAPSSC